MISIFMMMVILGGMFLQVPIGKLSDIIDRRKVILFAAFGIIVTSICVFIFYKSYIVVSIILYTILYFSHLIAHFPLPT